MNLSRRKVLRLAGAAGAAGVAMAVGTTLAVTPASPANASQSGWRWCRLCQGFWFAGNPTTGACPANGTAGHSFVGSGNYAIPRSSDWFGGDQPLWRWCNKCEGLWYAGNGTSGVCPAGGGHDDTGSGDYSLNKDGGDGQANWRWCHFCQGLWFSANATGGVCPANGSNGHSASGSGNYHIFQE